MPESGSSVEKESVKEKEVDEFGHTVNSMPERESTTRRDQTPLPSKRIRDGTIICFLIAHIIILIFYLVILIPIFPS